MPQKSSVIKCQKCGYVSNIITDTCIKCGSRLDKICGECGFANSVEKNHCDQCGGLLALKPDQPPSFLNDRPKYPAPSEVSARAHNPPPPPPAGTPKGSSDTGAGTKAEGSQPAKYHFELQPISDTVSEKDVSFRSRMPGGAPASGPAAPAAPPPPKKPAFGAQQAVPPRPRNLKKIYGALVTAALLAVLGFVLYLIAAPHLPALTLKMAAGAYLKRLSTGRYEDAYGMLSTNSKSAWSMKNYVEYNKEYYSKVPSWEFKDVEVFVMEPEAAMVKYQLREGTGTWRTDYVSFVKEHDKWTRPYIWMLFEPIDSALAKRDYPQALFLAQKLYLTDPMDPRTSGYLCVAEFFMQLYDKSADSCRRTLLSAQSYPVGSTEEELFWYRFYYADSLRFTGKLELALDEYNGALDSKALTEKERCPLYMSRADTYVKMSKYNLALTDMLKADIACANDTANRPDFLKRMRFMNGDARADAISFAQRTKARQDLPTFGELRRLELAAAAARLGPKNAKFIPKDSWIAAHLSGPEYRVVLRQETLDFRTRRNEVRDIYTFMVNLWTGAIKMEQGGLPPRKEVPAQK